MEALEFFKEMGRKGGKIGGKRSLETMTPGERQERARKGGLAGGRGRPKKSLPVDLPEVIKGKARAKTAQKKRTNK